MKPLFLAAAVLACVAYAGCGEDKKTPASPSPNAISSGAEPTAGATTGGTQVPFHLLHPVQFPMEQGIVAFPPRNEPNAFFTNLQVLYREYLKRSQTALSYVDAEGQNVWLTEYFRFYLNGCSHAEATSRTLSEIRTGITYPVCGGESLVFPPRNLPYEFQAALEATYREVLGRSQSASYVDNEGANVWLAEYLRYRVAGNCDHAEAESRVFAQIQGQGVQPVCAPPTPPDSAYRYFVFPEERTVAATSGVYSLAVATNRPDAQWTATSDHPSWLWVVSGSRGTGGGTVTYAVSANTSTNGRSGRITVAGLSGLNPPAVHTVLQQGQPSPQSCTYGLVSPKQVSFGSAGGSGTAIFILMSGSCTWVAGATDSWVSLLDTSGTGNITVRYVVASNPSTLVRQATIQVRWPGPQVGENITITQSGR